MNAWGAVWWGRFAMMAFTGVALMRGTGVRVSRRWMAASGGGLVLALAGLVGMMDVATR